MVIPKQPLEKSLSSRAIPSDLQKHIDRLSVLIDSSPQVPLLAANLHEDFINEKCIAETLVTTLQSRRIPGSKLFTPQANRLIAHLNTSFSQQIFDISMTEIKSMIQPNRILNNFRWKAMAFVRTIWRAHSIIGYCQVNPFGDRKVGMSGVFRS